MLDVNLSATKKAVGGGAAGPQGPTEGQASFRSCSLLSMPPSSLAVAGGVSGTPVEGAEGWDAPTCTLPAEADPRLSCVSSETVSQESPAPFACPAKHQLLVAVAM